MPREISPELIALLGLSGCETQTTLSLYPVAGDPIHLATAEITFNGTNYRPDLIRIDEIRQSLGIPTDMLTGEAEQVTKTFGKRVTAEELVKAVGVVGRYYRDPNRPEHEAWEELFRGEFIAREITEEAVAFEIVHDLVAAGYCVANWTLAENCQFVFKDGETCGYAGDETACNKRRKSTGGCLGRANEHRFGGMEYPDIQAPTPPLPGGGGTGPGFPTCPEITQFVLVRGRGNRPEPKQVRTLTDGDELYNPIWQTFHEIASLEIFDNQPIWALEADRDALGLSSPTHPVLSYREHTAGKRVDLFLEGDAVLTWSNGLADAKCTWSKNRPDAGSVMRIELTDGHIYCYSMRPRGPFIVCHNAKPVDDVRLI